MSSTCTRIFQQPQLGSQGIYLKQESTRRRRQARPHRAIHPKPGWSPKHIRHMHGHLLHC